MTLDQKQQFNIPSEITFRMLEKDITITRKDEYCNISEIRKTCGLQDFSKFQKYQKEYLENTQKEINDDPVKTEGHTTFVHEKILERVLRWYEVDEKNVIDKFVHPNARTIGQYKYNKVEMFVHLESKYINGSKFCPLFGKQMHRWVDLKGTKELFKTYSEHHKIDFSEVIKKGLGYDSADIWIPQNLLPMLAIWCSIDYAIFVSDVMNLYHNDPLKLAAMAIKEHDRQNGTKTITSMESIPAENKEEIAETISNSTDFIIGNAKRKNPNVEFEDEKGNKQTEQEFRDSTAKYIHSLLGVISKISYEKSTLLRDNISMEGQLKPIRDLRDAGIKDISQLALTRSAHMKKNNILHEEQLSEKDAEMYDLKKQIKNKDREIYELQRDNDILMGENDDLNYELDNKPRKPLSKAKIAVKEKKYAKDKADALAEAARGPVEKPTDITSLVTDKTISRMSVYTTNRNDGIKVALVPGVSKDFNECEFEYRGYITFNDATADDILKEFKGKNTDMYIDRSGYVFTIKYGSGREAEQFEREFTLLFKGQIKDKHYFVRGSNSDHYRLISKENVCGY